MSDQFVGEIRLFAGNFAPAGFAFCNGQLLSIAQHTALFSILGTRYGGDGKTTFALPNLAGAAPMGQGQGAGLTNRQVGETGGSPSVTLLATEMPAHTHSVGCYDGPTGTTDPTNAVWAGKAGRAATAYYAAAPIDTPMSPGALAPAGSSQPHNNMQPYLGLNYIIALEGYFPSRP